MQTPAASGAVAMVTRPLHLIPSRYFPRYTGKPGTNCNTLISYENDAGKSVLNRSDRMAFRASLAALVKFTLHIFSAASVPNSVVRIGVIDYAINWSNGQDGAAQSIRVGGRQVGLQALQTFAIARRLDNACACVAQLFGKSVTRLGQTVLRPKKAKSLR